MRVIYVPRYGHIEHQLARITVISLQLEWFGMAADLYTDTVAEDAFGSIAQQVLLIVAGRRFTKAVVMRSDITV